MADQARYRIHIPLQDHEGAKSDRTYTCTRGATFWAPEGEFKALSRADYSRIDTKTTPSTGDADSSSSDTDS